MQRECRIGDLTSKCRPLDFSSGNDHIFCTDSQIGSIPRSYLFDDVEPQHSLVVAIRNMDGDPLGCAQLEMISPLTGQGQCRSLRSFVDFFVWQNGPDDRTFIKAHITGLDNRDHVLRIHDNVLGMEDECTSDALGDVFGRQNGEFLLPADAAMGATGNLDTLIPLEGGNAFRGTVSTNSLPLFGHNSILGRSIALIRDDGQIICCGTIMRQQEYPQGEIASLQGYQNLNNPPLPPIPRY